MDTWQVVGTALGLGLLSGIRLYLTVFLVGLSVHFGWFHLPGELSRLAILGDPRVLIAAGAATLVEFFADKIPWLDSIWDSIHTFIRPVGAALLGSAIASGMDPAWQIILAILAGGVALTGHSTKAATRLVVNHSPEPFSNIGMSLIGDMSVPVGIWFVSEHPLIALGCVVLFVAIFLWLGPGIIRGLRAELRALGALFGRLFASGPRQLQQIPIDLRAAAQDKLGDAPDRGLLCISTKSAGRLSDSIGYLGQTPEHLVFVTRRTLRRRVHAIPRSAITRIEFERGLMLHTLLVHVGDKIQRFDCFAGTPPEIVEQLHPGGRNGEQGTLGAKAYA